MHRETKKRIESVLTIIAIATLFTIVYALGLCWLFFDKKLDSLFIYLDAHAKPLSSLVKAIVFISAIICLATPVVILCGIYTVTKEHRDGRKSLLNRYFKSAIQHSKWLSPLIAGRDVDHFMKSELANLREYLAKRRDEYLSMYNSGPLFLTEARDRFKNKMSALLDYQEEEILYMHAELQVKIATKIRSGHANQELNYMDELEAFYKDTQAAFKVKVTRLNNQLQALSDDHLGTLQNLSKTFSNY